MVELIRYKDLKKEDQILTDQFSEFVTDIDFKLKEAWRNKKTSLQYDFDEYFKLGLKRDAADILRIKGYTFRFADLAANYNDPVTHQPFVKKFIIIDLTAPLPIEEE